MYVAAGKTIVTLAGFLQNISHPGLTSSYQLKRKKIRESLSYLVNLIPTVTLPGLPGTNALLLRVRTLDKLKSGKADFSYENPASKKIIQSIGLLFPITTARIVSCL